VWSAFSLSWPALLTQVVWVVSVVFLIDLALDSAEDSIDLFRAAELVTLVGITFLFAVILHKSHNVARSQSSLGFPYRMEFSLPVSTLTLLLTPLLYICALTQVAVFVPGLTINLLFFNSDISVFPISFMIFQLTSLTLMLTWWTENGVASIVGWFVALALYLNGLLMPEFIRVENSWVVTAENPTDYAVALLFTAALLLLTYFGVRQQRSGESLLEFGNALFNSSKQGSLRDSLPLPVAACPTNSPMAAEYWKERQLHGGYNALFGGLAGAAATLTIWIIINVFAVRGNNPELNNVWVLAIGIYGLVCVALTIYMYGVRYKNGVANVSVHDKTTPLSTARLTLIRSSATLGSALMAGLVMLIAIGVLGPLLVDGFENIRTQFLESFDIFSGLSLAGMLLRAFLSLLTFLTALLLLVTFLTWTMLYSKPATVITALVPAYIFLWSIVLMMLYGDRDAHAYNQAIDTVFANHLWIAILLIPVSGLIMSRDLLHDRVLSPVHMLYLLGIGLAIEGLNFAWLFDADHYGVLDRDIWVAQLSYLMMQGLLPLLAVILALWTSNKIRHL